MPMVGGGGTRRVGKWSKMKRLRMCLVTLMYPPGTAMPGCNPMCSAAACMIQHEREKIEKVVVLSTHGIHVQHTQSRPKVKLTPLRTPRQWSAAL